MPVKTKNLQGNLNKMFYPKIKRSYKISCANRNREVSSMVSALTTKKNKNLWNDIHTFY